MKKLLIGQVLIVLRVAVPTVPELTVFYGQISGFS